MEYDGSVKIDTALELSHLQEDIDSLDTIFEALLGSAASFGIKFIMSGINAASGFGEAMIKSIAALPNRFIAIGQGIVTGLWNGVASLQSWLYSKINSFFGGIVSSVKKRLGINSPSKVFRDLIGANMAKGVYEGFAGGSNDVENGIAARLLSMTQRLHTAVAAGSYPAAGSMSSVSSTTAYNSYDTKQVFNFNTPVVSPSQLARAARRASLVY